MEYFRTRRNEFFNFFRSNFLACISVSLSSPFTLPSNLLPIDNVIHSCLTMFSESSNTFLSCFSFVLKWSCVALNLVSIIDPNVLIVYFDLKMEWLLMKIFMCISNVLAFFISHYNRLCYLFPVFQEFRWHTLVALIWWTTAELIHLDLRLSFLLVRLLIVTRNLWLHSKKLWWSTHWNMFATRRL